MQKKIRVLIVDDNEFDRELFQAYLELYAPGRWTIDLTTDGRTTRQYLNTTRPDCVLLDYRLPDTDGLEMLPDIAVRRGIPVVLITGYHKCGLAEKATELGASSYLNKNSITPEILGAALVNALRPEIRAAEA